MSMRHLLPGCCAILAFASACSNQEPAKVAEQPMTPAAASPEPRVAPSEDSSPEPVRIYVDRQISATCRSPTSRSIPRPCPTDRAMPWPVSPTVS